MDVPDMHTAILQQSNTYRLWISGRFENDTVEDAAKLMSDKQIRRLPVLNENKQLVGILSLGDLAIEDLDPKAAGAVLAKVSAPT